MVLGCFFALLLVFSFAGVAPFGFILLVCFLVSSACFFALFWNPVWDLEFKQMVLAFKVRFLLPGPASSRCFLSGPELQLPLLKCLCVGCWCVASVPRASGVHFLFPVLGLSSRVVCLAVVTTISSFCSKLSIAASLPGGFPGSPAGIFCRFKPFLFQSVLTSLGAKFGYVL